MHIILSPAKTMAGTSKIKAPAGTTPRFNREAIEIALHMAQYPAEELGRILKLSPKLMLESYRRFQNFHSTEEEPIFYHYLVERYFRNTIGGKELVG